MASISRAARLNSPANGAAAKSRSSKTSISAATASRRARKGLFLSVIASLTSVSGPCRVLYLVLHLRDNEGADREGLSVANDLIASMVLAIWLYLLAARGGFWLAAQRDDDGPAWDGAADGSWPAIAAIIPARDEAECVAETIGSLIG